MTDLADRLADLRSRLEEAGKPEVAAELLAVERAGSTSGEILAQTGVILRRLLKSGDARRLNLAGDVSRLDHMVRKAFRTRNHL